MTDFVVARSLETLEAASCDYQVVGDRITCDCETRTEAVEVALKDLDLVRWCDKVFGSDNVFARVLADEYATHPGYRMEWHNVRAA